MYWAELAVSKYVFSFLNSRCEFIAPNRHGLRKLPCTLKIGLQFSIKSPASALMLSEAYAALKRDNILVFWSVEASPVTWPVCKSLLFSPQLFNLLVNSYESDGSVRNTTFFYILSKLLRGRGVLTECPPRRISQPCSREQQPMCQLDRRSWLQLAPTYGACCPSRQKSLRRLAAEVVSWNRSVGNRAR